MRLRTFVWAACAASLAWPALTNAADSGTQALQLDKTLVAHGQRWAGAPHRQAAIDDLVHRLRAVGLTVQTDKFMSSDPKDGSPRPMENLVGRFRPDAKCRVLLGTHFDTRHVAEEDPDPANRDKPIPGADDGTSGVAVLLTLAKRFPSIVPKGLGVDVVLFDGEEMGYPQVGGYCKGSEHYAQTPLLLKRKPQFGIILDMVCDPRGIYHVEDNSRAAAPDVVQSLWAEGERSDPKAWVDDQWLSIGDDHLPLSAAGVRSLLLIGFNYPEWHTLADTPDKCSAPRLGEIVDVLSRFLSRDASKLTACRL